MEAKAKKKRVFSKKKFIEWCHKFGDSEERINENCELWANKLDGKEVIDDKVEDDESNQYYSHPEWEEEVEYEN